MFYITMLIRNYYENFGSFEGIENTFLQEHILEMFKNSDLSYTDFLYSQLGYKAIPGFTIEETVKMRALYTTRQYAELKRVSKIDDLSAIQKKFVDNKIPLTTFPILKEDCNDKYEDIVNLLAFCYKTDPSLLCIYKSKTTNTAAYNNTPVPLFFIIELLSANKGSVKSFVDKFFEEPEYIKALPKITYKKGSKLYVQNKVCMTPVRYTDEEKENIQRLALQKAAYGYGVNINYLFRRSNNLVFLSVTSNNKYLKLLDFTNGMGITYKKFAKTYNINIPNQLPLFAKYGFMFYKITPDKGYMIDTTCVKDNSFIEV